MEVNSGSLNPSAIEDYKGIPSMHLKITLQDSELYILPHMMQFPQCVWYRTDTLIERNQLNGFAFRHTPTEIKLFCLNAAT